jgi:transposase
MLFEGCGKGGGSGIVPLNPPSQEDVAQTLQCPRCGARKSWLLKDGRRRCAACRHDWTPGRLPLRLSAADWRAVLEWFVRGATSAEIASETGLDRKRILRALLVVRQAMLRSTAAPLRRATRTPERLRAAQRQRTASLGLLVAHDDAWAEVIPDAEAEQLGRRLRERDGRHSLSGSGLPYAAIVYRGRLYRVDHAHAERVPFGRVEAFWAYLQRQLRSKGGIRRERLGLYLADFAWRYNHRKLARSEQVRQLLTLIRSPR